MRNPFDHLTSKEQLVLAVILGLLITGWAVKAFRTAHPAGTGHAPAAAAPHEKP